MRRVASAPGGSPDHAAEVAGLESRVLVREHVRLDVAEGGVGLVPDAVVEGLDDIFLEVLGTRMRAQDGLALCTAVVGIGQAQDIHLDAGRHQSDDRMHVLRDAWRRMQRDRRPDRIDVLSGNAVTAQEIAGGIRTVDLKTLIDAAVLMSKAHVVKHRPCIEELLIERQTTMLAGERTPVIDPAGMVKQQRRFSVPDKLCYLAGEFAVRNADPLYRERHRPSPAG